MISFLKMMGTVLKISVVIFKNKKKLNYTSIKYLLTISYDINYESAKNQKCCIIHHFVMFLKLYYKNCVFVALI